MPDLHDQGGAGLCRSYNKAERRLCRRYIKEVGSVGEHIGTVHQIIGPVVDIKFSPDELPELLNAIKIPRGS